jgi:alpha-tubulin suppressor-like RCC1 family protein
MRLGAISLALAGTPALAQSSRHCFFLDVAAGDAHSMGLLPDGRVMTWGSNADGQLGDGTTVLRVDMADVPGLPFAIAATAGGSHSLALLVDGTIRAWGWNGFGQLGDGTFITRLSPVPVVGVTGARALSGGASFSLALLSDGTVLAWGEGTEGQLGNGTPVARAVPEPVLDVDDVVAVSAGGGHALALRADGTVWSWGASFAGQLGDGTFSSRALPLPVPGLPRMVAVSSGLDHSLALTATGQVWAWGGNVSGALGDGSLVDRPTPQPITGLPPMAVISAGALFSAAVEIGGRAWTWGSGASGRLGDGTTADRAIPAPVAGSTPFDLLATGDAHVVAVSPDRRAWGWGSNGQGQIGQPFTAIETRPVVIPDTACENGAPSCVDVTVVASCAPVLVGPGATDPDGDALTFAWSSSCGATFSPDASAESPLVSFADPCDVTCDLTCTATDGTGAACASLVRVELRDDAAPVLTGSPADVTVDCAAVPPPAVMVASDACDPAPRLDLAETRIDGRCAGDYRLVRAWTATDRCGNAAMHAQVLTVTDTTPPVIEEGSGGDACLWPPRHDLHVLARGSFHPSFTDDCSEPVTWRFVGCLSDQPVDGLGDGDTEPDCVVATDGESVLVRAERSGRVTEGRSYSVSAAARDACGNESAPAVIARVRVPHAAAGGCGR